MKAVNPTAGQVAPPADQFELYNATVDPLEMNNLYDDPQFGSIQQAMVALMTKERTVKRLTPDQAPWADGSAQQFPFTPN